MKKFVRISKLVYVKLWATKFTKLGISYSIASNETQHLQGMMIYLYISI